MSIVVEILWRYCYDNKVVARGSNGDIIYSNNIT